MIDSHAFSKEVRGMGPMLGIEFAAPDKLEHRAAWKLPDSDQKGLFSQLVTVPLLEKHRILSQSAGHDLAVVVFLPPPIVGEDDGKWIRRALDDVLGDSENVGGAIWALGRSLAGAATKGRAVN